LIPTLTGPASTLAPLALIMSINSGFKEAPPTKKPSISA